MTKGGSLLLAGAAAELLGGFLRTECSPGSQSVESAFAADCPLRRGRLTRRRFGLLPHAGCCVSGCGCAGWAMAIDESGTVLAIINSTSHNQLKPVRFITRILLTLSIA